MREISAQDYFSTPFCAQCGVNDVTKHGEICPTCQWMNKEKTGPMLPETKIEGRREIISPMTNLKGRVTTRKKEGVVAEGELKCKWIGCNNKVKSKKGLAAYCAVLLPSGKTHRQLHIEQMRETDPDYGKHSQHRRRLPSPRKLAEDRQRVTDSRRDWLSETAKAIQEATVRVEGAQRDLEGTRSELEALLEKALDQVKGAA